MKEIHNWHLLDHTYTHTRREQDMYTHSNWMDTCMSQLSLLRTILVLMALPVCLIFNQSVSQSELCYTLLLLAYLPDESASLPSFFPSFLPSFFPSFLPSFLPHSLTHSCVCVSLPVHLHHPRPHSRHAARKLELLRLAHNLRDVLPEPLSILSPLLRRINVRRTFIIRRTQHRYNRYHYRLHSMHRRPSLIRCFISRRVITWRVQYRDAHAAVWIYIRMPHLIRKAHCRRIIRVVPWERHYCIEEASFAINNNNNNHSYTHTHIHITHSLVILLYYTDVNKAE